MLFSRNPHVNSALVASLSLFTSAVSALPTTPHDLTLGDSNSHDSINWKNTGIVFAVVIAAAAIWGACRKYCCDNQHETEQALLGG